MMKLNEKDKRALKIGALLAVAILVLVFGSKWQGRWAQARAKGAALRAQLDAIDVGKAKQKGLMSLVPAFKMPEIEAEQKFLFREKLNEQLKKAGIKSEVIQIQTARKSPLSGYKLLHLTCSAKCKFSQVLDLLTRLNENPYLVGIEEFKIKVDAKKRQEVQLNLTVSTFVR